MEVIMNLSNLLKNNENARKIFGAREIKIIEKQLLGIELSQSEKNRLSRDIRKKFDFIKEVSRFEGEFSLKKGLETKKAIQEAKEIILADQSANNITKIILYGSAIENRLSFQSDIDIAVRFNRIDLSQATLFRKRISGKTQGKIDIQVYNFLPRKIVDAIDSNGKIIYAKNK